jgi:hypothetical protein
LEQNQPEHDTELGSDAVLAAIVAASAPVLSASWLSVIEA